MNNSCLFSPSFARFFLLLSGVIFSLSIFGRIDSTKTYTIYQFDIKEEIAPPMVRVTQKAMKEALEQKCDMMLIHMNTYGGLVDAADSIRTILMKSPIPVVVYIDNNAASAGALISIACDSIYMHPSANIGAATVVNQQAQAMPDKYQSYMRSMMRATAEHSGRDPLIAEAMVDERVYIPGVIDSGKVLTFTASEAMKHGYCEGKANSIQEVYAQMGFVNYKVIKQKLTALDKFIAFMINPMISGILIMIIVGGIYFELQTPGVGFPLFASMVAAVLYFSPLYMEGLAHHWEILLFVIGVILVIVELFVIPGFGIIGISGIGVMIVGLTLSMINNIGFDFSHIQGNAVLIALSIVIISIFFSITGSIMLTRVLLTQRTGVFAHMSLTDVQAVEEGYTTAQPEYKALVGQEGIAYTVLRPSGKIEVNEEVYDATAQVGFIDKGTPVTIIGYESAQLIVEKKS